MRLGDFIDANREEVIERWEQNATGRLQLDLETSQLRNNLPEFIDDVAEALRSESDRCRNAHSARTHGQHRMKIGVDIGRLTEEMTLVGETVAELARDRGYVISSDELLAMMNAIGQGAAASVSAYAELRDKQLADQAAQHFSFIAHEIRNPLHNASLAAQTLQFSPEEERSEWLKRLNRSLEQLAELVDDALVEARLYGEPRLRLKKLSARKLLEEVLREFAPQTAEREQTLELAADDFVLEGDHAILLSALSNLVKNAIKFTPDGGRIEIHARRAGDTASFTVTDQCGGIAEKLVPRLFQKFVQAAPSKGGSGLGLVIVRQAARAHRGTARVDNRPGKNCSFVLELPLSQGKGAAS